MAFDEEKAIHVNVPLSASPTPIPLDENHRKSVNIPHNSITAIPHIQSSTRASIRQTEIISTTTTTASSKNKQQSPPPNLIHP
jgi:hypothetical protein